MRGKNVTVGAYSGLTAGAVSAGLMGLTGTLPMLGKDPRADPAALDFIVTTIISIGFGAVFATIFGKGTLRYSRSMMLGSLFGLMLWIVGPLTLLPVFSGMGFGARWNAAGVNALTPSLIVHVIYGAILGTFYVAFKIRRMKTLMIGAYSGLIAGVVSAAVMGVAGNLPMIGKDPGQPPDPFDFIIHLLVSIGFGTAFAMVAARRIQGYVGALVRGIIFGTVLWAVGPVTLLPVFRGISLGASWNAHSVAGQLPSLAGHLVFGGVVGAFYFAFRRSSPDVPRAEPQPTK